MTTECSDLRIGNYLTALGSSAPTPGGGSAAGLAGALASALGLMVASVAREKEPTPEREALATAFRDLERSFLDLVVEDERAFAEVMAALRVPRDAPARAERVQTALERAADVPLRAAAASVSVLEYLDRAEPHASRSIVSDIGVAAHLALAVARSCLLNVAVNVRSLHESAVATRLERDAACLRSAAEAAYAKVIGRVDARVAPPQA